MLPEVVRDELRASHSTRGPASCDASVMSGGALVLLCLGIIAGAAAVTWSCLFGTDRELEAPSPS